MLEEEGRIRAFLGLHIDMALAIQQVTEAIVLRLACNARRLTGSTFLVLTGAWPSIAWPTGKSSKAHFPGER